MCSGSTNTASSHAPPGSFIHGVCKLAIRRREARLREATHARLGAGRPARTAPICEFIAASRRWTFVRLTESRRPRRFACESLLAVQRVRRHRCASARLHRQCARRRRPAACPQPESIATAKVAAVHRPDGIEHTVPRVHPSGVRGARARGSRLSHIALRRRYMPHARLADRPSEPRRLHLQRTHERGTELANCSVRSTDVPMAVGARGPSVGATDGASCRNRVAHRGHELSRRDDARSVDGCSAIGDLRMPATRPPLRSISDIG